MDLNNVRRVSSAGYRLPQRPNGTRPGSAQPHADRTRQVQREAVSVEQNPDKSDQVKQDRVWKELMRSERRGIREWEKNWSFLKNYDQMGEMKTEEPLPSYVSLFSDQVPNTTNQTFGSRLSTPLGNEMIRLDRLLLSSRSGGHHRRKHDPERLFEGDSGAESLHIQAPAHNGFFNVDSAKL